MEYKEEWEPKMKNHIAKLHLASNSVATKRHVGDDHEKGLVAAALAVEGIIVCVNTAEANRLKEKHSVETISFDEMKGVSEEKTLFYHNEVIKRLCHSMHTDMDWLHKYMNFQSSKIHKLEEAQAS